MKQNTRLFADTAMFQSIPLVVGFQRIQDRVSLEQGNRQETDRKLDLQTKQTSWGLK